MNGKRKRTRHANTRTAQGGDDELDPKAELVLPEKILVVEVVDDKGECFVALFIKDTK